MREKEIFKGNTCDVNAKIKNYENRSSENFSWAKKKF